MSNAECAPRLQELVRLHHALLYRYAYRLTGSAADAEDLTQQTYLLACRKLDQLRDDRRAKGWLCVILRNCYLKKLRDDQAALPLGDALESVPAPHCIDSDACGVDSDQLQAALAELPEEFRSPLILFYFEEFSYQEIAEQLEVPIGTIMSRLSRAKTRLKQALQEQLSAGHAGKPATSGL